MIVDRIARLPLYADVIPGAKKIAEAFQENMPQEAPCEVREKSYATKDDQARRFEVHFHTIDLMMARSGAEVIHLCAQDELTPAEALPGGADGRKLDGGPRGTAVILEAGYFCAIFPGEAHMVGGHRDGQPGAVEKWVVKAPCPAAFAEADPAK